MHSGCGLFPAYDERQRDVFQAGIVAIELTTGKHSQEYFFPLACPSNAVLVKVCRQLIHFTGRPGNDEGNPIHFSTAFGGAGGIKAELQQWRTRDNGLLDVLSG
ncbi:unnamed protein product [Vitrella brassicaformis CCMP3155]|nr:unnamed protein product [Vitrella brassicaformis CCMP3155]|eukprot:CEM00039.1 unnamed protein product [Vitrella brassicaformis CCMP3155]